MSAPQDDFGKLRQLLVCKRYEQPPPGYFDAFSEKVVARLEAEQFSEYSSWWQWLVDKFDAKPVVACLCGCAVSGLLLGGFHLSQVFENEAASNSLGGSAWLGLAATPPSTAIQSSGLGQAVFLESSAVSSVFKADSPDLLFGENALRAQPLSFHRVEY